MGGDEFGLWAGLQGQLQQIPAVQPQNGAAVRVDVADGLQPDGQFFRRFQAGEEDQVVHLPRPPVALVDAADLPGDHETGGGPGRSPLHCQPLPQGIDPLPRGDQLLPHLRPPSRMGEVPCPYQLDAFAPGPPVQVGQVAVPAGGPGEPGVDMKISNIHGCPPLFTRIPSIIPFFSLRCNARAGFLPLFLSYSGS